MTVRLIVAVAVCFGACAGPQPTAPSTASPLPSAPTRPAPFTISGTVWVHQADGMKPFANSSVFGWIDAGTSGWATGVPTDADGGYVFSVPPDTRVRIHIGGDAYQPCAVTVSAVGNVTRDIHVVADPLQLGAHLPSPLLADTPTLSGVVFEVVDDVRRPITDARVELDGLFGMGVVTATTLTDAEGRYVLCGLQGESSTYIYASKNGYRLFEATAGVDGNTTLDIELRPESLKTMRADRALFD